MNADIQRLIDLQRLDSIAIEAMRHLAEEPERLKSLDSRVEGARARVTEAKERLAAVQTARREVEKEVAVHQGRLSKYRDQIMAVKTNIEYQAMQKEIEFAQNEVKALEDTILERMLEGDECAATVKQAEAALAAEQKDVDAQRRSLSAEIASKKDAIARVKAERGNVIGALDPKVLAVFELVASRRSGVAMAEARDGICTICHVRLRPQVFNSVRRNEEILQCDRCNRILYFATPAASTTQQTV
jgi:uncharacterized protein